MSAARILRGQIEGHSGEETVLAIDNFPYLALSKVCQPTYMHCLLMLPKPPQIASSTHICTCSRTCTQPTAALYNIAHLGDTGGNYILQGSLNLMPCCLHFGKCSTDLQCGQAGSRQCKHSHCLPLWCEGQC